MPTVDSVDRANSDLSQTIDNIDNTICTNESNIYLKQRFSLQIEELKLRHRLSDDVIKSINE